MIDEMVEGYWDGKDSHEKELPKRLHNRSAAYKHGWLNGRDDRLHSPRDKAVVLRAKADLILNN